MAIAEPFRGPVGLDEPLLGSDGLEIDRSGPGQAPFGVRYPLPEHPPPLRDALWPGSGLGRDLWERCRPSIKSSQALQDRWRSPPDAQSDLVDDIDPSRRVRGLPRQHRASGRPCKALRQIIRRGPYWREIKQPGACLGPPSSSRPVEEVLLAVLKRNGGQEAGPAPGTSEASRRASARPSEISDPPFPLCWPSAGCEPLGGALKFSGAHAPTLAKLPRSGGGHCCLLPWVEIFFLLLPTISAAGASPPAPPGLQRGNGFEFVGVSSWGINP